jgi:hypothetical protein
VASTPLQVFLDEWSIKKTYNERCKSFLMYGLLKRLTTRVASFFPEVKVDQKDLQRALQVFFPN